MREETPERGTPGKGRAAARAFSAGPPSRRRSPPERRAPSSHPQSAYKWLLQDYQLLAASEDTYSSCEGLTNC
ncbi:Hypothetical predicted protein [Marmota monax]|uniref:Uncharacterized protein n=1 Tax=Marmota monax TaxID=9995 RepID=A0A5E4AML5_MARMO|nr:hypothetical protein GHT09_003429 [Marmota monax]VTJ57991.1 Hypothetical predicted protein [Marmota monax]